MTPHQAILHGTDANHRGAGQLAALKQGPQNGTSVLPKCQPSGVGKRDVELSTFHGMRFKRVAFTNLLYFLRRHSQHFSLGIHPGIFFIKNRW